jgi:uncharacterized protein (UPF0147 family)
MAREVESVPKNIRDQIVEQIRETIRQRKEQKSIEQPKQSTI